MVMYAFISGFINELNHIKKQDKSGCGWGGLVCQHSEIRVLLQRLEALESFLCHAERRLTNAGGRDASMVQWLSDVHKTVYDADDIINECTMEQQLRSGNRSITKLLHRGDMAVRIKVINEKLRKALHDATTCHKLGMQQQCMDVAAKQHSGTWRSTFNHLEVVGQRMKKDTDEMVKLLCTPKQGSDQYQVFAITGIGGIGKTTLARRIFDEERVHAEFHVKVWLSVCGDVSDVQLLKEIINGAGGSFLGDGARSDMEKMLVAVIRGKRLFLVLDGLWTVDLWCNLLQDPLKSCGDGSRVLITTRVDQVARSVGAVHLHQVALLSKAESWVLVSKMLAFQEVEENHDSMEIAMKATAKCRGHPLALKLIGGVLGAHAPSDWGEVTESLDDFSVHSEELDFMWAYEALPCHLKPCFLFCALFPENRVITRRDLTQLWIAEGFIKQEENKTVEDLAEEYYSEMISRNLVQPEVEAYEEEVRCTMHQLVRELALQLAQADGFYANHTCSTASTIIRLHLSFGGKTEPPESTTLHDQLRTLAVFESPSMTSDLLNKFIDQIQLLRVLDLRQTEIDEVPDSISALKHLRYLNLSGTNVAKLPNSIKDLYNLRYLCLNSCKKLDSIPTGTTQLYNLRSLDVLHTKLAQLPSGIKNMKNLNSLLGFFVSDVSGSSSLDELKTLSELRELHIGNLNMAKTRGDEILLKKKFLQLLELSWNHEPKQMNINIIKEIQPSTCLQRLTITGFPDKEYPSWLSSPDFRNLAHLVLEHCRFCQQLPSSLGDLPALEYLRITSSKVVVTIKKDFFGKKCFPRLERLVMEKMSKWEKWEEAPDTSFPCLKSLHLKNCNMLISLPRFLQHVTSLTELVIQGADRLREVENFSSVLNLRIEDSTNIEKVSNFSSLKSLKIVKCPALEVVKKMPSLEHLHLVDLAMESLPVWFGRDLNFSLRSLYISANDELLSKLKMGGEESFKVEKIRRFSASTANKSYVISNN
ncbi:putative disease resistance protein RGA3 [Dioscorea cayenensis subsp. rotundata]|uniref:Disease resistance protein RGA3 n=1 Tax=Dioscorea cayennensis subsp. rotundata TaxID=55577 RepID=A0AB40BQV0_DIOCR|nr:putative disease resistance protein RGA3 [Dioscorea cayenensis subsp. rotundata]